MTTDQHQQYVWLYQERVYVGPFATQLAARDWAVQSKLTNGYIITKGHQYGAKVVRPISLQVS